MKKKKSQRPVRHQQMQNGSSRRSGKKGEEGIFEDIMVGNLPNLMKNINLHVQSAQ